MSTVALENKTILVTGAAGFIGKVLPQAFAFLQYMVLRGVRIWLTLISSIPPYSVYNIGNQNPENLLKFVQILSEELIRAKVLPEDYNFESHKELVLM